MQPLPSAPSRVDLVTVLLFFAGHVHPRSPLARYLLLRDMAACVLLAYAFYRLHLGLPIEGAPPEIPLHISLTAAFASVIAWQLFCSGYWNLYLNGLRNEPDYQVGQRLFRAMTLFLVVFVAGAMDFLAYAILVKAMARAAQIPEVGAYANLWSLTMLGAVTLFLLSDTLPRMSHIRALRGEAENLSPARPRSTRRG